MSVYSGRYFVYVLLSEKDKQFYIGMTKDLERRFSEHNAGKTKSTAKRRPLVLVYFEAYQVKKDAMKRERYFKQTKGKAVLRNMLKNDLSQRS